MKIGLYLTLILIIFSTLLSQNKPLSESLVTGENEVLKDTLCHKYDFTVGDTLEYRVESGDSVVISWDSPLTKERFERIRIVCERIDKKTGHFFLSHEYTEYLGYENKPLYEKSKRDKHEWLNKKVVIEMDSLGKRYTYKYQDTSQNGFTAGGPFQGLLLQPIGRKCSLVGESWITQNDTTYLAENGFQTPMTVRTDLFENKGKVDTLGYNNTRIDITFTGNSEVLVKNQKALFLMYGVINGHTENYISDELHIPVWSYFTQEQNFTIDSGNDKKTKGFHFTYSIFQLDRYVSGKKMKSKK